MKKVLGTFWLAVFLLSVPLFAEARSVGEEQSASLTSALKLNQTSGVGRIRTRRRIRRHMRRGMRRRHMRRVMRRRYRRMYVIRRRR
ncbi:MAG TPA: hypothetical protein VGC91_20920 [Pyrinomonadaceae bacterium]